MKTRHFSGLTMTPIPRERIILPHQLHTSVIKAILLVLQRLKLNITLCMHNLWFLKNSIFNLCAFEQHESHSRTLGL